MASDLLAVDPSQQLRAMGLVESDELDGDARLARGRAQMLGRSHDARAQHEAERARQLEVTDDLLVELEAAFRREADAARGDVHQVVEVIARRRDFMRRRSGRTHHTYLEPMCRDPYEGA